MLPLRNTNKSIFTDIFEAFIYHKVTSNLRFDLNLPAHI